MNRLNNVNPELEFFTGQLLVAVTEFRSLQKSLHTFIYVLLHIQSDKATLQQSVLQCKLLVGIHVTVQLIALNYALRFSYLCKRKANYI